VPAFAACLTALSAAILAADPSPTDAPPSGQAVVATYDGAPAADAGIAAAQARSAEKLALAAEVAAGRRNLRAAADRFRELDGGRPWNSTMRQAFPGRTPRERYARVVIAYAEHALRGEPGCEAALRRLRHEVAQLAEAEMPETVGG
jgi:hypothetical protein